MITDDYARFQGDNFIKNVEVATLIEEMASKKMCTSAQLALAWLLAQGDFIVPIPGTKRIDRVKENLDALQVQLTPADFEEIERISPKGFAAGGRF
jgi:aryl-alcohol dehydrogenase-like predicted oxidoreductase